MYIKMFEEYNDRFTQFSQLIGKMIEYVYISNTQSELVFKTDDDKYHIYTASGDCCNDVWFYHFNGIDFLIHQIVRDVESKDWRNVDVFAKSDSCEEACIWTLKTNRGYIDIELRNSHNGYYGGDVGYYESDHINMNNFKIISEDF